MQNGSPGLLNENHSASYAPELLVRKAPGHPKQYWCFPLFVVAHQK